MHQDIKYLLGLISIFYQSVITLTKLMVLRRRDPAVFSHTYHPDFWRPSIAGCVQPLSGMNPGPNWSDQDRVVPGPPGYGIR